EGREHRYRCRWGWFPGGAELAGAGEEAWKDTRGERCPAPDSPPGFQIGIRHHLPDPLEALLRLRAGMGADEQHDHSGSEARQDIGPDHEGHDALIPESLLKRGGTTVAGRHESCGP